jgi:hypothetical protein
VRCCRMRSFIARAALDNAAPAGLMLAAALAGGLPSGVAQPPLQSAEERTFSNRRLVPILLQNSNACWEESTNETTVLGCPRDSHLR